LAEIWGVPKVKEKNERTKKTTQKNVVQKKGETGELPEKESFKKKKGGLTGEKGGGGF